VIGSAGLPEQIKFLIAGQETEVESDTALRHQITKNNADHRFDWHDHYIPNELVESYFAASNALVLSYQRAYIGASGVLSQAATYGLPVIASDSADLGAVVSSKQLGMTFETENSAAFADVAKKFLELPDSKLDEYKKNLAELRSERSWQNIIAKHIDFYSNRLSRPDH
jgi:glycosyltransferase involved in cell wall biosynthesis